jgi:TetR/AcrR family transcriptional regulator
VSIPNSRVAVLQAAERVFAEKGFDGARMDDIAREAKVNTAMIYYFFKNKERLFQAVLDDMYSGLEAAIRPAPNKVSDPVERFFAMVSGYFDYVDGRRTYPQIIQREVIGGGKFLGAIARHLEPMYKAGRGIITEGIKGGSFRKLDAGDLLLTAVAMTVFYFNSARLFGLVSKTAPLSRKKVAARKREIIELLKSGVLTPSYSQGRRT